MVEVIKVREVVGSWLMLHTPLGQTYNPLYNGIGSLWVYVVDMLLLPIPSSPTSAFTFQQRPGSQVSHASCLLAGG
jgi:hypothetical protein